MEDLKLMSPQYLGRAWKIRDSSKIKKESIVLDVGCGDGDYLSAIGFPKEITYIGLDISKSSLSLLKRSEKRFSKIFLIAGDAQKMPLKSDFVDHIISSDVLEHIPQDVKAFNEMKRVMKNKAFAMITAASRNFPFFYDPINYILGVLGIRPIKFGIYGWGHQRLYTKEGLSKILKEMDFKMLESTYINHEIVCLAENYAGYFIHNFLLKGQTEKKGSFFKKLLKFKKITELIVAADNNAFKNRQSGSSVFVKFQKV